MVTTDVCCSILNESREGTVHDREVGEEGLTSKALFCDSMAGYHLWPQTTY